MSPDPLSTVSPMRPGSIQTPAKCPRVLFAADADGRGAARALYNERCITSDVLQRSGALHPILRTGKASLESYNVLFEGRFGAKPQ